MKQQLRLNTCSRQLRYINRCKDAINIFLNVLNMFDTNGQMHGVFCDSRISEMLVGGGILESPKLARKIVSISASSFS